MRRWLLILLAGGLSLAHAAAGTPRIEVMNSILALGTVRPNSVTPGRFVILNTGDAPLRILNVTSHCGCTVAELPDRTIPPGGQMQLSVKYTAGSGPEDVSKHIDLTTNDPVTPKLTLYVQATVQGDLEWSPRTLNLDWPVPPDFQGRIVFRAADGIAPSRVYDPAGFLQIEWRPLPGEGWEAVFRLPDGAEFRGVTTLCVESNSRDYPLVKVPVYFQKASLLRLTPTRTSFWVREGEPAPVRRITIARKDGRSLKVLRAEPSRDYFVVTVVRAAGEAAVIEITLKSGLSVGPCDGFLHIVTDAEELYLNIPCKVVRP